MDTYDNALNIIDKIENGKIKLADVKNDQIKFKSNLTEIKREPKKSFSSPWHFCKIVIEASILTYANIL